MPELQRVESPQPVPTDRCAKKVQFLLGPEEQPWQQEVNVAFLSQLKQAHAGKGREELQMMLCQYKLAQCNIIEELEQKANKSLADLKGKTGRVHGAGGYR